MTYNSIFTKLNSKLVRYTNRHPKLNSFLQTVMFILEIVLMLAIVMKFPPLGLVFFGISAFVVLWSIIHKENTGGNFFD